MLYITGDTPWMYQKMERTDSSGVKGRDTIIVAGDFGVGGWKDEEDASVTEEQFYDWISKLPYSVLLWMETMKILINCMHTPLKCGWEVTCTNFVRI